MTNTLGSYLQNLRKSRGLMQKQLAATIGVEPSYLSNLERGIRVHLGELMLERLATALSLTASELAELRRFREASRLRIVIPPYASPDEVEVLHLLTNCLGRMPAENFELIRSYIENWHSITCSQLPITRKRA
ncbi:MAG: helix-turn-helix domain-containing protein [Moraxellaceae bacterium]